VETFSPRDLQLAIDDLAICEYFPADEGARAAIMRLLARMVPHKEALQWLVTTYTNKVGKWKGPVELRAVLCTKYKPSDGVEAFSSVPGFSADDSERACLEAHEQRKAGWIQSEVDAPRQIADPQSRAILKRLSGKVM
jgi:hypothetical protein